jgi:hypothetical protein
VRSVPVNIELLAYQLRRFLGFNEEKSIVLMGIWWECQQISMTVR